MEELQWQLIGSDGQQYGPYQPNQLATYARDGKITPETMVWTAGLEEWIPASQVEGLFPAETGPPVLLTGMIQSPRQPVGVQAPQPSGMEAARPLDGHLANPGPGAQQAISPPLGKMRGFRLAANLIDTLVLVALVLLLSLVSPVWAQELGWGIWVALQSTLLAKHGQTVGKWLQGMKIVDQATGNATGFKRAVFVRWWLIYVLPYSAVVYLPLIFGASNDSLGAALAMGAAVLLLQNAMALFAFVDTLFIFRTDQRCIHDLMAKTVVIQTRERGLREKISYWVIIAILLTVIFGWLGLMLSLF